MKRVLRRAGRGFPAVLLGLVWGTLVLFPHGAMARTPAGTVIPNAATAYYRVLTENFASPSNTALVTVDAVYGVAIAPPRSGVALPGASVTYRHTVTNAGNGSDACDLTGTSTQGFAVEFLAADNATLLADTNGNGIPDTGPVPPGGTVDIVVRITAPPGAAPGTTDNTTVTAASGAFPAVSSAVSDITGIPSFWDPLTKTVDPPGQVVPGTVVTYTNAFGNAGPVPAANVTITDNLDARLVYVPGSATLPAGLAGAAVTYDPAARTVTWTIPQVPAGYAGRVSFRAAIDPATPSDTVVTNRISLVSDQTPAPAVSNAVSTTVVEQMLRIAKRADRATAEIGDTVAYAVRVENASAALSADNVLVRDGLPHGFRYVPGSAAVDGVSAPDPPGGTRPEFFIGLLAPGASRTVTYRARLSVDASLGDGINRAWALGLSAGGNLLRAGPAQVRLKVREGVLGSRTVILGRVFEDRDGDRMPGDGDPGVQGIRIFLEDGTFAVTDGEGKYSIDGVAPGEHVLKLDRSTLPPGLAPVPLTNAFAGDGGSQFVSVPLGGPARGDFGLAGKRLEPGPKAGAAARPEKKVLIFAAGGDAPPTLEAQVRTMPAEPAILAPADGAALARRWTDIDVRVPEGAEHELRVNGEALPRRQIGTTIRASERKIVVYRYVGATLEAGPNDIALSVLEAGGRASARKATVTAPGPAARLVIDPPSATVPGGGKTPTRFTVTLLDRWGRPAPEEAILTVLADIGTVAGDDPDPNTPGRQVRAEGGAARFDLLAADRAGSGKVRVLLGNVAEVEAPVFVTAGMRDWVVAGLGTASAGLRSSGGDTSGVGEPDDFKEGPWHDERLAVFAKGTVHRDYLFTGAYDTGKEKAEGLFMRHDPDRYYPVYGDGSTTGYEAESRRKLFLKVERDRSSVLFGDFRTGLTANEFSRYDRAFNGVKADIDTGAVSFRSFATQTGQVIVKDQIPGNGTSGYYFLRRKPVVENSDRVWLEVRDRYRPEVVLRTIEKRPFTDYTLDPDAGALLFKEPVPTLDPDLNPYTIVAVYEAEGEGDEYSYGGRAGWRAGRTAEAGVTAIVEEKGLRNDTLAGADAAVRVTDRVRLSGEYASSDTQEAGTGSAWKAELAGEAAAGLKVGAYYRAVDAAFRNPSMTGSETGWTKYGAKISYDPSDRWGAALESYVHENTVTGDRLGQATLGGKTRVGRATLEAGARFLREEKSGPAPADTTSQILYAGVSGKIAKDLDGSVRHEQVLSEGEVTGYPSRTQAGLSYRLAENITARLTQEIQQGGEKRHATVAGLESRVTENTILSSRYLLEDTISGGRAQASIGLNNKWRPERSLTLNTRAERIQSLEGDSPSGTALAVAAEYLPDNAYKVTGRYEILLGDLETTNLFSLGAAVRLADGVSLLPKMSFWNRATDNASEVLYDGLVGLAWRPRGTPSITLLESLRFKVDRGTPSAAGGDRESLVSSTEATWRAAPRWTLLGKYAGKYSWEKADGKRFAEYTDLLLAGVTFDVTDRWDVGLQGKLMSQYGTGVRSLGAVARAGYRIRKNLYGGAGYSMTRLDDRDLSGTSYKAQGPFVELRFKFDEETLGLASRPRPGTVAAVKAPEPSPPPAPPRAAADDKAVVAAPSFAISGNAAPEPFHVLGSVESFDLLVNGSRVRLPEADVVLKGDNLEIRDDRLAEPARFAVTTGLPEELRSWRLVVRDARGAPFRVIEGLEAPPDEIVWDGLSDAGALPSPGEGYDYQMETVGRNGVLYASVRRVFGVTTTSRVVLDVTVRGYRNGGTALSPEGKEVLREAARIIRKHPDRSVRVEGHSDSRGNAARNMAVSLARAEAAAAFLVDEEGIPRERLVVAGAGGTRPAAGGDTPRGRSLNRRVEIRGEFRETQGAPVLDAYRTSPSVRIDGAPLDIDPDGRFTGALPAESERIGIDMVSRLGKTVRAAFPLPRVEIAQPEAAARVPAPPGEGGAEGLRPIRWRLAGRTEPGNEVSLGGKPIPTSPDGTFAADVDLRPGDNVFGLLVRNPAGCARLIRWKVVASREAETGRPGGGPGGPPAGLAER